jgi:hypothetical protein
MARTGIIAITGISKQNYNLAKEKGERERERRKRRKRSSNNPRVNKYIKVQRTTHLGTFTHLTTLDFILLRSSCTSLLELSSIRMADQCSLRLVRVSLPTMTV